MHSNDVNSAGEKVVALQDAEGIRLEAASWITVLGREHVTAEELARFKSWLRQSHRHKAAFESLSALCAELPILKELDDIAAATVSELTVESQFLPWRTFGALAAGIAALALIGVALYDLRIRPTTQVAEYETAVGEQQTFDLLDGSSILLNTGSRVEIKFSRAERHVRLHKGEAHFDVAKDTRRPFSVFAADGVVTALGTAFAVRLKNQNSIEVTVEEGRVALSLAAHGAASDTQENAPTVSKGKPIAQLSAGQSTTFVDKVDNINQMSETAIKRKLSWRKGMIAYSGQTLSEVLTDISRYTDFTFEVEGEGLLNRSVAGYFLIEDAEGSIESLASSFGLKVEWIDETRVRILYAS